MSVKQYHQNILLWILILVALHSIGFGLALITFPVSWIEYFGFSLNEKFFADQGGVFHIIISTVYLWAAYDLGNAQKPVTIACITKFTAAVFLFSYFFFEKQILVVLLSGITDLLMGIAILTAYLIYRYKTTENPV